MKISFYVKNAYQSIIQGVMTNILCTIVRQIVSHYHLFSDSIFRCIYILRALLFKHFQGTHQHMEVTSRLPETLPCFLLFFKRKPNFPLLWLPSLFFLQMCYKENCIIHHNYIDFYTCLLTMVISGRKIYCPFSRKLFVKFVERKDDISCTKYYVKKKKGTNFSNYWS